MDLLILHCFIFVPSLSEGGTKTLIFNFYLLYNSEIGIQANTV